jgi:hypothetical protein
VSHLYYKPRPHLLICSRIITELWGRDDRLEELGELGPFSYYVTIATSFSSTASTKDEVI